MHIDQAGYRTAIDASNIFPGSLNSNHIGDLRAKVSNLDQSQYEIYGVRLCEEYASFKHPPKSATANADSYAWLATAKFFSNTWGTTVSRDEGGSEDSTEPDPEQEFQDPEITCAERAEPLTTNCLQISIPDDFSLINLDDGACYTKGNRKWCDMYTFGTCQVTIGWDTSENGGQEPFLTHYALSVRFRDNLGDQQCAPAGVASPGGCLQPEGTPCATGYLTCIKRVGVDCMP
ncbi:hypothetical protein BDY21DRAFT_9066 [Lineolata rhizophorae]|uniref:Uncharacterized protein n=1 Tax=Lineolata rhizophorae TaxID=578093 RepID=A0A6A6PDY2_9PEZI|nr:hypothetical protein BDY21DRAFT_9066 [Lineolata rhizophorae]